MSISVHNAKEEEIMMKADEEKFFKNSK